MAELTPEEHYVAHQLLVKMNPGHIGLLWSASAMTGNTQKMQRSNKRYGWLRRKFGAAIRERKLGVKLSASHRQALSNGRKGLKMKPHTAETKAKMSAASIGRKKSEAHRQALSVARLGKKLCPVRRIYVPAQEL